MQKHYIFTLLLSLNSNIVVASEAPRIFRSLSAGDIPRCASRSRSTEQEVIQQPQYVTHNQLKRLHSNIDDTFWHLLTQLTKRKEGLQNLELRVSDLENIVEEQHTIIENQRQLLQFITREFLHAQQ